MGNTSENTSANDLAQLIQNSTLLRSYEQMMGEFEADNERKHKQIGQLERDQQQLLHENNVMSDQLYQLKTKQMGSAVGNKLTNADGGLQDNVDAGEQDKDLTHNNKMVELLKRNHDVMMEKYEVYRQRNETLEKSQQDKEKLYLGLKTENDSLASQLYEAKRAAEDARQEKYLFETRLRASETSSKELNEQAISLRK